MQRIPQDQAETDLLTVIVTLHAEDGPMTRAALSVAARGRGLDVGRPLSALISNGFVEEVTRRPSFLRRLFGAKSVTTLHVTEAGRAALAPPPPQDADAESQPDQPSASEDQAAPAAAPTGDTATAAPETAVPETPPSTAQAVPAPEAAPVPADTPSTAAAEAPAQPDEDTAPPQEDDAPAARPIPAPEERPAVPQAPPAAPAPPRPRPKRLPLDAFTEVLGGDAIEDEAAPSRPAIPADLLEGLTESLSVMGLELTQSGQILIANRLAHGARPGEALSQVALFAFAHAVRNDLMTYGAITALGLTDYAIEVMKEIEKLRDAGELGDGPFEADMRHLWSILQDTPDRATLLDDLLLDPIGGLAPPALLPEDLRQVEDLPEDEF